VWVGRFDEGLDGWAAIRPTNEIPETRYRPRRWDGMAAVEAVAERSMSMLARSLDRDPKVDPARTPVLCWRWRIDAPVKSADITKKVGDDYAARVYVGVRTCEARTSPLVQLQMRLSRAHAAELSAFAEAAVRGDASTLASARDSLRAKAGSASVVDAAGVLGNFERMTRIADATGIPLDAASEIASEGFRSTLGLDACATAQNSPPEPLWRRALAPLLTPAAKKAMARFMRRST